MVPRRRGPGACRAESCLRVVEVTTHTAPSPFWNPSVLTVTWDCSDPCQGLPASFGGRGQPSESLSVTWQLEHTQQPAALQCSQRLGIGSDLKRPFPPFSACMLSRGHYPGPTFQRAVLNTFNSGTLLNEGNLI